MTPHDAKWLEVWRLLGELQNEVAETGELIRELKQQRRQRRAPQPKPQPETAGNVVCLPGVTLAKSRRAAKRPEGGRP
jgi:hypothetical protein